MIGRAALGNPWVFSTGWPSGRVVARMRGLHRHLELVSQYIGYPGTANFQPGFRNHRLGRLSPVGLWREKGGLFRAPGSNSLLGALRALWPNFFSRVIGGVLPGLGPRGCVTPGVLTPLFYLPRGSGGTLFGEPPGLLVEGKTLPGGGKKRFRVPAGFETSCWVFSPSGETSAQ